MHIDSIQIYSIKIFIFVVQNIHTFVTSRIEVYSVLVLKLHLQYSTAPFDIQARCYMPRATPGLRTVAEEARFWKRGRDPQARGSPLSKSLGQSNSRPYSARTSSESQAVLVVLFAKSASPPATTGQTPPPTDDLVSAFDASSPLKYLIQ